jgi:tetratricopeptide (TPR) repeat protein
MTELTPADEFALEAVSGWLMLGNPKEAAAELCSIPGERLTHPRVLLAAFELHAHMRQWEDAAEAARTVMLMAPDSPAGYVKCAFALHELRRTEEAWKCLLPASRRFPDEWVVPYNLACYACQMGREQMAVRWLERAINAAGPMNLKRIALEDPDLQPLRARIRKLKRKRAAKRPK